jgi:hypothetical protein
MQLLKYAYIVLAYIVFNTACDAQEAKKNQLHLIPFKLKLMLVYQNFIHKRYMRIEQKMKNHGKYYSWNNYFTTI